MNDNLHIILEGVTGSTAYGLDHENSDVDLKGVFVVPTKDRLSIYGYKETVDSHNPDITYHEVEKFMKLAMRGNPTILEMLFLEEYTKLTELGKLLVENRKAFLSNVIYKSYGGYAISQARKLNAREAEGKNGFSSDTKNRYAKHARHCFRLLNQGRELLETGDLHVRVKNRDELFAIGELPVDRLVDRFEEEFGKFDKINSVLPDHPDQATVNDLLLKIREKTWVFTD